MPLFLGTIRKSSPDLFEDFAFCNMVSTGRDPFKDVIPIPYSKRVLEGYEIMIHGLQLILKDMVDDNSSGSIKTANKQDARMQKM
jgi:hypothetical protein